VYDGQRLGILIMKILYIITGLAMGGAENQVVSLADAFAARGHDVRVAYFLAPAIVLPRSSQVHVVWLGGTKSIFGMAKAFMNLVKLVQKIRPDVVHSHMVHANILSRLVRLISKVPHLVCTAHNTNEGGKLRMLLYRITDKQADVFTNVSREAVEAFEHKKAAPPGRMLAIHNGIDTQRFKFDPIARQRLRAELAIEHCQVFIAIGRFHEAKDYPNLLAAFSRLSAMLQDVHLLIVGDGELRPQLEQQILQLDLQKKVTLLGIRKDVAELLSAADIFVLSSAWEGFGLVVAEAMACERVIVATDSGGVAEVLGRHGFLIEPHNSEALVKAMKQATQLQDRERKELAAQARQRIEDHYSLEKVVACWKELYR